MASVYVRYSDTITSYLLNTQLPWVQVAQKDLRAPYGDVKFAGFGVQCKVISEMGKAFLDPATRTLSSFTHGPKSLSDGADQDVFPLQFHAVEALANYDPITYSMDPYDGTGSASTWSSRDG